MNTQHDDGASPARQGLDDLPDRVTSTVVVGVGVLALRDQAGGVLALLPAATPQRVVLVHEDAADVPVQ